MGDDQVSVALPHINARNGTTYMLHRIQCKLKTRQRFNHKGSLFAHVRGILTNEDEPFGSSIERRSDYFLLPSLFGLLHKFNQVSLSEDMIVLGCLHVLDTKGCNAQFG